MMNVSRFFNTAGPIDVELHYHVPPLSRLDLDEILLLMRQRKYFIVHAPRQTGKTSALLTLRGRLNEAGEFRCVYVNVEVGQAARERVGEGMRAILSARWLGRLATRSMTGSWERCGPPSWIRSAPTTPLGKCCRAGRRRTPSRWC